MGHLLYKVSSCVDVLVCQDLSVAKSPFPGILNNLWWDTVCVWVIHGWCWARFWIKMMVFFSENASKTPQFHQISKLILLHETIWNIFQAYKWAYLNTAYGFGGLVYEDAWCDKLYNHIVFLCVLNILMSTFCFGILDLWNVNFMRCTSSFGKATTDVVRMSWTIFLVNFLLVQTNINMWYVDWTIKDAKGEIYFCKYLSLCIPLSVHVSFYVE